MINPSPYILKDRNARVGFTYTVTFPVNSMAGFGFTVEHQGQIASVTAMNVASYSLRKNGSAAAVPFSVERGDSIMLDDVVKIDDGRPSTFLFRAPKFDQQDVAVTALTQIDQTRKHLFVINYADQTVSVIDTETDTVESTITLPHTGSGEGYEFQCIAYRSADDFMYVFGLNRMCKIDANPESATFKNVYSNTGVENESSHLASNAGYPFTDAVYNYVSDCVYLGSTVFSQGFKWNFEGTITEIGIPNPKNSAMVFAPNNKIFSGAFYDLKIDNDISSGWLEKGGLTDGTSKGCYISKDNSVIIGKGAPSEYNIDTFELVRVFSTVGTGGQGAWSYLIGNIVYSPYHDLVLALTYEGGPVGGAFNFDVAVIDKNTNTEVGSFFRANKETNDTIARSMVYGAFSKKFYFMSNGTSPVTRIHKLNPQLWIDNGEADLTDMIDGYITVGNLSYMPASPKADGRYANSAMAFNHLIPS